MPNNDIAVPRKKRIEKVQEYGALWAKDWSTEVTHVIVDGNLRLNDVTKAIGPDRLKVNLHMSISAHNFRGVLTDVVA